MIEIEGIQVELSREHKVKWVTEDGRKFWGRIWNYRFTPFGDLMTVHALSCNGHMFPEDMEQLISENQILDVDPLIKWHPPVFKIKLK